VSGAGGGRALGEEWQDVGAAEAGDVVGGALQDRKQGLYLTLFGSGLAGLGKGGTATVENPSRSRCRR
jgi:hypothetical protein